MVSVVIPVYNSEKSIERCVNSILNQDYQDLELILVNDGSEDNSGSICDRLAAVDSRVNVIHKENCGVSSARNIGIELAKGEYITFVDSDDELMPNALSTALQYLGENAADAVAYGWLVINERSKTEEKKFDSFDVSEDIEAVLSKILENYSAYGGGYPWNKLWKVSAFNEIPKFKNDLYYFEDLEWVVRSIKEIKKIVVCPECLYKYYYNESSATNSASQNERRELGYHHSVKYIIDDLDEYPQLQKWFSVKYYPEIVNGLFGAIKYGYKDLRNYLNERFKDNKNEIIQTCSSAKLKLRCRILCFLIR